MTLYFKQGVWGDLQRPMIRARGKVHKWYRERYDQTYLRITATRDGNHSPGSLHYHGLAEDYAYPDGDLTFDFDVFKEELGRELGPAYDIVCHSTHLHVEWDPK